MGMDALNCVSDDTNLFFIMCQAFRKYWMLSTLPTSSRGVSEALPSYCAGATQVLFRMRQYRRL
eukprot:31209-Eustigmatos_ZCMA.PRE.1